MDLSQSESLKIFSHMMKVFIELMRVFCFRLKYSHLWLIRSIKTCPDLSENYISEHWAYSFVYLGGCLQDSRQISRYMSTTWQQCLVLQHSQTNDSKTAESTEHSSPIYFADTKIRQYNASAGALTMVQNPIQTFKARNDLASVYLKELIKAYKPARFLHSEWFNQHFSFQYHRPVKKTNKKKQTKKHTEKVGSSGPRSRFGIRCQYIGPLIFSKMAW
jgi:hypothetical protein